MRCNGLFEPLGERDVALYAQTHAPLVAGALKRLKKHG